MCSRGCALLPELPAGPPCFNGRFSRRAVGQTGMAAAAAGTGTTSRWNREAGRAETTRKLIWSSSLCGGICLLCADADANATHHIHQQMQMARQQHRLLSHQCPPKASFKARKESESVGERGDLVRIPPHYRGISLRN